MKDLIYVFNIKLQLVLQFGCRENFRNYEFSVKKHHQQYRN